MTGQPHGHLLLVRHGEPLDPECCHGARSDPGLSGFGRRQTATLALRVRVLANELGPVRRLVSSPAARAIATAVALGRDLGRQHEIDEHWRERDWGTWEGRPWDQLWQEAPQTITADAQAYLAWTPPGGEEPDAVAARVAPALEDALARPGTTVVVTHAGAVRQALASALDLPLVTTLQIEVGHARITVLARDGDAVTLTRVGA